MHIHDIYYMMLKTLYQFGEFVLSHYVHKCYKTGNTPDKLIFFLHGYNGCIDDIDYAACMLKAKLNNAWLILPQSDQTCEKNPQKKQWYSLLEADPENLRRNPQTSVSRIMDIYDKTGESLLKVSQTLNRELDELQKKYGIDDNKTYIMGFSQGAMLAIFMSLTRQNPVKTCFALSGVVAGKNILEQNLKARPKVWMFHGKDDLSVQYKTLEYSLSWLKQHGIETKAFEFDGLAHRMTEEEMGIISQEILQN